MTEDIAPPIGYFPYPIKPKALSRATTSSRKKSILRRWRGHRGHYGNRLIADKFNVELDADLSA